MPRIRQYAERYQNEDFVKAVKTQLVMLNMEQKDLAQMIGVCEATITQMLRHPEKTPVERLRKTIDVLSLEPETILRFCGFKEKDVKRGTV